MASRGRPSTPTVVSLAIGLGGAAVKVWDWLDRANGLQAWLTANKGSVLGDLATQALNNAWIFFLVGVLLWWHDVETKKHLSAATAPTAPVSQPLGIEATRSSEPEQNVDFRAVIDTLSVDATSGGNPMVLAIISVTNHGRRAKIDRWQLMYWANGRLMESGEQRLQNNTWMIDEQRKIPTLAFWQWGFEEYIGTVTATPMAPGETRQGFFWAQITSGPISEPDLRTAYLQFQAEGHLFKTRAVGPQISWGMITAKQ